MNFPKEKLCLTLLLFVHEGLENVFQEYEANVLPILPAYNGELICRLRPAQESYIETAAEQPYEIHLVSFITEEDFAAFREDAERKKHAGLFQEAVREVVLIEGKRL